MSADVNMTAISDERLAQLLDSARRLGIGEYVAVYTELQSRRQSAGSEERVMADEILSELIRARTKFPGKNVTFAALVEEVGELATATFEEGRDRVRKEAVQVAVMAMRMVLDGDHTFDSWRAEKGLDPLTVAQGGV